MEEYKVRSALLRTSCAVMICLVFIVLKFVLKEEKIIAEVYNYLASDIVFLQ